MVIRENWDFNGVTQAQQKRMEFTAILHELSHSAGYDEDEADILEKCARRNLSREEALKENVGEEVSEYRTNIESFECRYVPRWSCRRFTLLEPPPGIEPEELDEEEEDMEDDDSGSPWCGRVTIHYGRPTFSFYVCVGVPFTVCWEEFEEVCRLTSALPGAGFRDGVFAEGACSVSADSHATSVAP